MIVQKNSISRDLFSEKSKQINFLVEILKRKYIGKLAENQKIIYSEEELSLLKKIGKFILWVSKNECQNFRTKKETEVLILNLLKALKENREFVVFAFFCPSYKKGKEVFGFNEKIGETTKKGINNLSVLRNKLKEIGINVKAVAVYSDLTLENADKLKARDFQDLEINFSNFKKFSKDFDIEVKKISEIGSCKNEIGLSGLSFGKLGLTDEQISFISKRSYPFYKDILGWSEEDIIARTKNLCLSCSIMGDEIKNIFPLSLMLMTENIYERGIFYSANNQENPLPVFYPHKTETKIDYLENEN